MSETPAVDETTTPPPVELPPQGDAAFAELMDTLVKDADIETPAEGAAPAATDEGAAGQATTAPEGAPAKADDADTPTAGDAGKPAVPDAGATDTAAKDGDAAATDTGGAAADAVSGDRPAGWTAAPAELTAKLGELSNSIEEKVAKAHHQTALAAVREEHKAYFDALAKHPRLLVGEEVPSLKGKGMETLRDAADAKDWQDAVKTLLGEEIKDRATRALEENKDILTTIHSSIELFQNNHDLIPGSKDFNVPLANKFAEMAKPYEVRVDGKLHGYSIPVQPIINQLRTDLAASSAKPPAEATPPAGAPAAAGDTAAGKADPPPQAGLQSKAGNSSDEEGDFSTLFGTIGLPNLRI